MERYGNRPLPAVLLSAALLLAAAPLHAAEIVVLGLFKGKAVLQVDGARRVVSEGQSTPEGITLIEADSEAALLDVGGRRVRYGLGTHIGSSYSAPQQQEVRIWPDTGGMYTVSGAVNGYSVSFLVDTGASLVAMNSGEAKRMGVDYLRDGRPGMIETASGRETAYRVELDSVSVGEIKLYNVPAVVLEGEMPSNILLGMSFLDRLEMQREGKALVLRNKW